MYRLHMHTHHFLLRVFVDDCVQGARTTALEAHSLCPQPSQGVCWEGKADIRNDDDDRCEEGQILVARQLCSVTGKPGYQGFRYFSIIWKLCWIDWIVFYLSCQAVVNVIRYVNFC